MPTKQGWDNPPENYSDFVVKLHGDRVRQASIRMLRGVVIRSPVDTGRFRANWQITEGRTTPGIVQSFNAGSDGSTKGPVTSRTIRSGSKKVLSNTNNFVTYYLTNNLPYAKRLENGWSDQAPQGMVALTLLDVTNWLNRQ